MLEVAGLTVRFGGVTALHDVEFAVADGSVCGLIGPNGAGKTTLFNCVSRLVEPGRGLDPLRRHRAAGASARTRSPQLGIARTFQHLALIPSLTVRENVMLGAHHRSRSGFLAAALRLPAVRARGARDDARTPTRRSSAWASTRLADRPVARPRLRPAQARRARPRAVRDAAAAGARRARLRPQPRRGRRARRPAQAAHARARPHAAARRAPHGPGDEGLRPGRGARLRAA